MTWSKNSLISLFTLLAGIFAILPAQAASSEWVRNDHSAVRLLSAVEATGSSETLRFGLEFSMQPGWKIYWRTPGDAGFPPLPDWTQSENIESVEMRWPRPERFEIFGLESLGYKDNVVFPLDVTPEIPGGPITMDAKIPYLVCADICVPHEVNVHLDLPAGSDSPSGQAHLISRFDGAVPVPAQMAGIEFTQALFQLGEKDAVDLQITAVSPTAFTAPDVIVEGPEGSYFHKPEISIAANGREAVFKVQGGGADATQLASAPLTVTLWDGAIAVEGTVQGSAGTLPALPINNSVSEPTSLWLMLGFALLGGLILNLMPCVLPVLSLKLLSVVSHGGGSKMPVRLGFLASAAGIITAFLILAGSLIAMKSAGIAIGWGIQFQNPIFLTIMVLIVLLFAANLLGLFQIMLPGRVSDFAATAGNQQKGLSGHFITGMFATLLATPCSAPFLGPAVGFALSQGVGEILMIFTALGLGLSLPYLLVATLPGMVTILPKPGPWMDKLKAVLSLALIGTAVWLLSVLDGVAGRETVTVIAALAALILAVFFVRKHLPAAKIGRFAPVVVPLLMASAVAAAVLKEPAPERNILQADNWITFDEAAIPTYLAQGKTVFVDVTADWCITCLYNKKNVLDAEPVVSLLASPDIILMRADWTRPDPVISDYLNRNGRYGIPFNIVYGPGTPQGLPLSEFLISEDVVSALEQAGATTATAEKLSQK